MSGFSSGQCQGVRRFPKFGIAEVFESGVPSFEWEAKAIAAEIGAADRLGLQFWKMMIWNTSRVSSAYFLGTWAYALLRL
jgi:hypothetical protein